MMKLICKNGIGSLHYWYRCIKFEKVQCEQRRKQYDWGRQCGRGEIKPLRISFADLDGVITIFLMDGTIGTRPPKYLSSSSKSLQVNHEEFTIDDNGVYTRIQIPLAIPNPKSNIIRKVFNENWEKLGVSILWSFNNLIPSPSLLQDPHNHQRDEFRQPRRLDVCFK